MAKNGSSEQSCAQRAASAVAAVFQVMLLAGIIGMIASLKRKNHALGDAHRQVEELQAQLASRSAKLDMPDPQSVAQMPAQPGQMDELRAQLETLKLQLENALADRDSIQALLDERNGELTAASARLTALEAPPAKRMSDFKAAATAAATELGVTVSTTASLQDMAEVKHIGATFEQRLYRAGVGTYWELANLTDDDLDLTLRLSDMQKLAISFDEVRTDAQRLAEETNSVGALWEGEAPDDFEPIPGIGKVFEQRLYNAGIRTYKDLANASAEQLASICKARKPLEPDYAGWIRQARKFLETRNG